MNQVIVTIFLMIQLILCNSTGFNVFQGKTLLHLSRHCCVTLFMTWGLGSSTTGRIHFVGVTVLFMTGLCQFLKHLTWLGCLVNMIGTAIVSVLLSHQIPRFIMRSSKPNMMLIVEQDLGMNLCILYFMSSMIGVSLSIRWCLIILIFHWMHWNQVFQLESKYLTFVIFFHCICNNYLN